MQQPLQKLLEIWRHGSGYFILSYMVHTAGISGFTRVCTTGDTLCGAGEGVCRKQDTWSLLARGECAGPLTGLFAHWRNPTLHKLVVKSWKVLDRLMLSFIVLNTYLLICTSNAYARLSANHFILLILVQVIWPCWSMHMLFLECSLKFSPPCSSYLF